MFASTFLIVLSVGISSGYHTGKLENYCEKGYIKPEICCRAIDDLEVLKHAYDNTKYYVCYGEEALLYECPLGEIFKDKKCIDALGNNGNKHMSKDCKEGKKDAKSCCRSISKWSTAVLKNPTSCRTYYQCRFNIPILKRCPWKLEWSVKHGLCMYPKYAKCSIEHGSSEEQSSSSSEEGSSSSEGGSSSSEGGSSSSEGGSSSSEEATSALPESTTRTHTTPEGETSPEPTTPEEEVSPEPEPTTPEEEASTAPDPEPTTPEEASPEPEQTTPKEEASPEPKSTTPEEANPEPEQTTPEEEASPEPKPTTPEEEASLEPEQKPTTPEEASPQPEPTTPEEEGSPEPEPTTPEVEASPDPEPEPTTPEEERPEPEPTTPEEEASQKLTTPEEEVSPQPEPESTTPGEKVTPEPETTTNIEVATAYPVSDDCLWGRIDAKECCKGVPPTVDVLLRNPNDCGTFFQCVHEKPMLRQCVVGLHWSVTANYCDWPEQSGCEINENK